MAGAEHDLVAIGQPRLDGRPRAGRGSAPGGAAVGGAVESEDDAELYFGTLPPRAPPRQDNARQGNGGEQHAGELMASGHLCPLGGI